MNLQNNLYFFFFHSSNTNPKGANVEGLAVAAGGGGGVFRQMGCCFQVSGNPITTGQFSDFTLCGTSK